MRTCNYLASAFGLVDACCPYDYLPVFDWLETYSHRTAVAERPHADLIDVYYLIAVRRPDDADSTVDSGQAADDATDSAATDRTSCHSAVDSLNMKT